ncbi:TIGR03089 family protein [Klenkia marina]|uniref:TIGR03089 family protein n=1 Tax=Klenkia marina TaxID=1960309 RepID=A0A1G4YDV2_9ACTN|nr:TIGR03089 family protein [Klenkia marina]SCX51717.1 TIGR03089 family protein [Klenkia marina]
MAPARHAVPADLLVDAVRRDAASPRLTHYDDATGERTELSGATLANWVAKSANLFQDEFDIGPGSRVAVALPVHWQTAAVLLGIWSCGAAVVDTVPEDETSLAGIDLVLAEQGRLDALSDAGAPDVLGLSLHPLGLGMVGYTGEARDFALEVRAHGDHFAPHEQVDPDAPGLQVGGLELSLGGLVDTARALADRLGVRAADRLLVGERAATEAGPVTWLLAPLAAGASVVLCRHAASGQLKHRAGTEKVTATLGLELDGIRELGRPAAS